MSDDDFQLDLFPDPFVILLNKVRLAGSRLPEEIKARVRIVEGLPDDQVRGRFNPRTGNTEIYYNKIPDPDTALRTMRHEIVGHWGFRELMGEREFSALKDRVDMATRTDRKIGEIAQRVRGLYPDLSPLQQAEEIIAIVAEEDDRGPLQHVGARRNLRQHATDLRVQLLGHRVVLLGVPCPGVGERAVLGFLGHLVQRHV